MVKKNLKLEEAINNWKRAVADYQNLEKRVAQERRSWIKQANKELILRLLPVLDTLILASRHVEDEGLKLSMKQFLDVLKNEGVEKIETEGQMFNPELMECVEVGLGKEGEVLEELGVGFLLDGSVLRPARVKVGKAQIQEKEEKLAKEELAKGDYL